MRLNGIIDGCGIGGVGEFIGARGTFDRIGNYDGSLVDVAPHGICHGVGIDEPAVGAFGYGIPAEIYLASVLCHCHDWSFGHATAYIGTGEYLGTLAGFVVYICLDIEVTWP